jgi:hypothetical protein
MPKELVELLVAEGAGLKSLALDWWKVSEKDLTRIVKSCSALEELRVLVDMPFSKLVSSRAERRETHKTDDLDRLTALLYYGILELDSP